MQLNNPLLSVIVPTFNAGKYLLDTLNSIQKQTLRSLEILVIDGGSKDNTVDIAVQAGCKLIQAESDFGYGDAFIKGLKHSNAKYVIQCCASDGFVDSDWMTMAVKYLESNEEISLVWGYPQIVDENNNVIQVSYMKWFEGFKAPDKERFIYFWLWYGMNLPEGNFVVRRHVLEKCFFSKHLLDTPTYQQEIEPWLNFLNNFHQQGYIPAFIPMVANYGRLHAGSISNKYRESGQAKKHVQDYTKRRIQLRRAIFLNPSKYKYRDGKDNILDLKFRRLDYIYESFVWRRRLSKIGVKPTLHSRIKNRIKLQLNRFLNS